MALQLALASKPPTVYGQLTARDDSGAPVREAIATFKGMRYVPANDGASTRGRTSWIAKHGLFIRELRRDGVTLGIPYAAVIITLSNYYSTTPGKSYWACGLCDRRKINRLFVATSTASPAYHLQQEHNIHRDTPSGSSTEDSQSSGRPPSFPTRLSRDAIEELALATIISSNLPFTAFENPFL
ncbi:transposase-like protein [Colletotrichum plurivorum]|uniref:Transposase-like protein n=1 Tax=Colletotrichum plurivorum TaxID=2175906 RepID=A0A8H6JKE3_9PEZI|nr:transposase-like protein [Colletotrichum plurivorum]